MQRGSNDDGLAVEFDGALVNTIDARQNLDQGRLPGPVLTNEGVDLPLQQGEVDVLERMHAGEGLVYALHYDDVSVGVWH